MKLITCAILLVFAHQSSAFIGKVYNTNSTQNGTSAWQGNRNQTVGWLPPSSGGGSQGVILATPPPLHPALPPHAGIPPYPKPTPVAPQRPTATIPATKPPTLIPVNRPPNVNDNVRLTYDVPGGRQGQTSGTNYQASRFRRSALPQMARQSAKNYQACLTPDGRAGHCRHLHFCLLPELKTDLWKFLDHVCIIERSSIGVCCPDSLTKTEGPNFGSALPAIASNFAEDVEAAAEGRATRPEDRGCGVATKQMGKITGGRPASPGEWPWMAALISNLPNKAFCGGSLITDRHVLTAGHCVSALKPREFRVRLGEYDFSQLNETRARDFTVLEMRIHIDFDPTTYENDIGVIKLQRSTLFNSYIWPICMPPIDTDWENAQGVVVGWGTQFFGGPHSKVLMEVSIPVWRNEDCQTVYAHRVYDTVMCAGALEGGRDSCQGDSGGPLMVQLPNNRWVIAGIVSWGIRCGEPNHPGIYTRVNEYAQWIIENSVF